MSNQSINSLSKFAVEIHREYLLQNRNGGTAQGWVEFLWENYADELQHHSKQLINIGLKRRWNEIAKSDQKNSNSIPHQMCLFFKDKPLPIAVAIPDDSEESGFVQKLFPDTVIEEYVLHIREMKYQEAALSQKIQYEEEMAEELLNMSEGDTTMTIREAFENAKTKGICSEFKLIAGDRGE